VFAADRTNPFVARRYDSLSPAVLRVIKHIARAGTVNPARISFCGEMAGRPLEAMALIGLGAVSLSMQAANVGPVKQMIRMLDTRALFPFVENLCETATASARAPLAQFAAEQGVPIERPA